MSGTELLVSYTRLTADGDFDFTYDPGTPLNDTDDQARTRENNDLAEHAWLAKLRTRILGLRLTLMDDWLLSESGNPGFGNRLYRSARDETRRHTSSATLETPRLLSRRVRLSLTGFQAYQRNIYRNPDAEPGLSRFTETHRSRSLGARVHAEVLLPELSQTFTLSAERRRERFVPESESPYVSEGFERERLTTSLTIEDVLALVDGRVLLTGAFRHREARDNFFGPLPFGRPPEERESPHWASAHGPSFGVVVRPARALTLKANRSHHERFPTLFELFGTGGEVRSNPELVPETGVTWDGGAVYALGRGPFGMHGRLEVTAFRSTRDSLIVLIQDSATTFKPLNLSSAEVEGLELALDAGVPVELGTVDEVRFSAAFTTQDARQRSHAPFYDDRWVPYVSPRELSLRTTFVKRLGATSLALRHEYAFFDRYYRDRANRPDRKVDERRVHDFGLRVGFVSDRFVVDLALENAFDERVQDVFGYPVPGRSVQLSTTFEIGR